MVTISNLTTDTVLDGTENFALQDGVGTKNIPLGSGATSVSSNVSIAEYVKQYIENDGNLNETINFTAGLTSTIGTFSGNVEAAGFTIGGVPIGTSTDTYWSLVGAGPNIQYLSGDVVVDTLTDGTFSVTGGNITGVSDLTQSGSHIYSGANGIIRMNTSDGSDTGRVHITGGGGSFNAGRGGFISLWGNEAAALGGIDLVLGNADGDFSISGGAGSTEIAAFSSTGLAMNSLAVSGVSTLGCGAITSTGNITAASGIIDAQRFSADDDYGIFWGNTNTAIQGNGTAKTIKLITDGTDALTIGSDQSATFAKHTIFPPNSATIASDAVTVTGRYMILSGEGGAADDLATINGGSDGMEIIIKQATSAQDITFKHNTGNIYCVSDKTMTASSGRAVLQYDGTLSKWVMVSFIAAND